MLATTEPPGWRTAEGGASGAASYDARVILCRELTILDDNVLLSPSHRRAVFRRVGVRERDVDQSISDF